MLFGALLLTPRRQFWCRAIFSPASYPSALHSTNDLPPLSSSWFVPDNREFFFFTSQAIPSLHAPLAIDHNDGSEKVRISQVCQCLTRQSQFSYWKNDHEFSAATSDTTCSDSLPDWHAGTLTLVHERKIRPARKQARGHRRCGHCMARPISLHFLNRQYRNRGWNR